MMDHVEKLASWVSCLLRDWRRAWDHAGVRVRQRVEGSLCVLVAPTQCWFYLINDPTLPLSAALLLVRCDPDRPDGEVRCLFIEGEGEPTGDAPRIGWLLERLKGLWGNMRANWTPGRRADPPPEPWAIGKQRMDEGFPVTMWEVPCDPAKLSIQAIVDHAFREEEAPTPLAEPRRKVEPHIFEMGMDRERVAVGRWVHHGAAQLMQALGLTGGWWLGLFLPREHAFGVGNDGDVDILAGPLDFNLDEEEWQVRINEESRQWPLSTARSNVQALVVLKAARDELIQWPPDLSTVVACEAKASWFRTDTGTWKRTHQGKARKIKGQMQYLVDQGVDQVGFLHLGATEPRELAGLNPWIRAAGDAAVAEDVFPEIYAPNDLPTCGYYTAVMGAVPFAAEQYSGAGGVLRIVQASMPNRAVLSATWRTILLERLAKLPQPRTPTGFIAACPDCGEWSWQGDPSIPTCTCSVT